MKPLDIILAASPAAFDAADRLRAAVRAAWPSHLLEPRFELLALDEFLARLELARPGYDLDRIGPSVILFDDADAATRLHQVVDRLSEQLAPALVLTPSTCARLTTDRTGVMLEQSDRDPEVIAAMVRTLAARQETVEHLARELRVVQRSQGGLRSEIDRINEELHLAATVQRALLPRPIPSPGCVEFDAIFRPVGSVSGDIYDVRLVEENVAAFFVADAVGHGIPAALLTMALSRSLTPRERCGGGWRTLDPSEVLSRLNHELCGRPEAGNRFATAVYGLVDGRTGTVRLAGAGHPPPLLFRAGACIEIETDGPLLGVFDHAEYSETEITLGPTDALMLYTDGLEMAFPSDTAKQRRPNRSYVDHLSNVARSAREPECGLDQAMESFRSLLNDQVGSLHQADDITILTMLRRAQQNAAAA